MKRILIGIIAMLTCSLPIANAQESAHLPDLHWKFADKTSIASSANLQNITFGKEGLAADVKFDPYFYLALPQKEISARQYRYLSVELYSSEAADKLSIYYKSPNGDWSIGASPSSVQKGWHHYAIDLETQIIWSAGDSSSPAARIWGGTQKKVSALRIDPGNQADRQIKMKEITLSTKPMPLPATTAWAWKEPGDLLGWQPTHFKNYAVGDGFFKGSTIYDSRLLSPVVNIDAGKWTGVEFRLKSTVIGNGEIYFRRSGEGLSDDRKVSFSVIGDGEFHTYKVDLSWHPQWKGTIEQFRFDPLNPADAQIEVQYLRFLPRNVGGVIPNGGFELRDVKTALPEDWNFKNVSAKYTSQTDSTSAVQLSTGQNEGQIKSAVFEFPATGAYQFEAEYIDTKAVSQLRGQMQYFDVFHHPLNTQPVNVILSNSPAQQIAKSTFTPPDLAAYGQLQIDLPASSQITLNRVSLQALLPVAEVINPWEERWQANWIMAPDADEQPEAARYFRHSLTINNTASVTSAKLQVTADNTARVVINGQELPAGANWNEWKLVDIYDLKSYLQNGENVVGIIAHNQGSSEGVLAELNVQTSDNEISINTDKSWLSFVGDADKDWGKSTFDANSWKPAKELGIPPVTPWGNMPYVYLESKAPLQVLAFNSVTKADLGQTVAVNLRFTPLKNTHHAAALKLGLAPTAEAKNIYDFPLIPLDTSKWTAGKEINLSQDIQLPRYFQPGKYFLTAQVTFFTLGNGRVATTNPIGLTQQKIQKLPVTKVTYLPGNIPAFEINGKTFPVMHVMAHPVNLDMHKRIIENSRDNDVNLVWLNVPQGFDWQPDAPAAFSQMDEIIAATLKVNPQAYIVLNVPIDPSYNPGMRKWIDLHPDQLVQKSDGSTTVGTRQKSNTIAASYASSIWKKDASKAWRELIRHVRSSSYGGRVIGYVPISGISWEWFYWGAQSKEFVDYSKPFTQAFSAWLTNEYNNDIVRLNKAWKTSYTTFDAIKLPSKQERSKTDYGVFLNPQKRGAVIDLRQFFTEIISGDILHFCHIVKEETNGTAICGTYYGYVMYIGRAYFGVHSGHYALEKVLSSPDIDFVMSPSRYADRELGGGSGFMTTTDSVKLHGKLYIDQADIRTFHSDDSLGKLSTLKDSVSVLNREFANAVVNGVAVQWYDFGRGWIAGDKRLMQAVGKMHQIEQTLQQTPRDTTDPQNSIAVINGEKSILYTKVDSMIQDSAVNQAIDQLNRTGAAWDAYLLNDLPKIGNYHYYLFLNCFNLTDAQKEYIDKNLKKDGNVLVWIFAPGIIRNASKSTFAEAAYAASRVGEVTGFYLKQITDGPLRTTIQGNDGLIRNMTNETFGDASILGPRFAAQNGTSLGHFTDNDQTSLAIKRFDNWTSVYSAAPNPPAGLLRNMAKLAKVPVVNNAEGDITYVSEALFAVHSLSGGGRVFTVGDKYKTAKELFSGQSYAVEQGTFTAKAPPGGTALFLLE